MSDDGRTPTTTTTVRTGGEMTGYLSTLTLTDRHRHSVGFEIVQVMGLSSDGVALYCKDEPGPTENPADAFIVASGFVKWDGCVNWATNEECMAHSCGPEDLQLMFDAIAGSYTAALRLMADAGTIDPSIPETEINWWAQG